MVEYKQHPILQRFFLRRQRWQFHHAVDFLPTLQRPSFTCSTCCILGTSYMRHVVDEYVEP